MMNVNTGVRDGLRRMEGITRSVGATHHQTNHEIKYSSRCSFTPKHTFLFETQLPSIVRSELGGVEAVLEH